VTGIDVRIEDCMFGFFRDTAKGCQQQTLAKFSGKVRFDLVYS